MKNDDARKLDHPTWEAMRAGGNARAVSRVQDGESPEVAGRLLGAGRGWGKKGEAPFAESPRVRRGLSLISAIPQKFLLSRHPYGEAAKAAVAVQPPHLCALN